jgi:hypothetical protein
MCFKLDNGSELFSVQDMHRLRKKSSGVMGSKSWARGVPAARPESCPGSGEGGCTCAVRCQSCACRENTSQSGN